MKRILIADDSATARMFLRKCLEIAGLREAEFLEAENGEKALAILREGGTDLLLTDMVMPVMDGAELLRRISASPKLSGLPIIAVTSTSNPAKAKELVELGALEVMAKPISPALMAAALRKIFPEGGKETP